jgi:hypothetical protein
MCVPHCPKTFHLYYHFEKRRTTRKVLIWRVGPTSFEWLKYNFELLLNLIFRL